MATGGEDNSQQTGLGTKCKYKQALRKLYMEIPPLITYPDELTGHLFANLIISDQERHQLRRVLKDDGSECHNKQLIDILLKKSEPHIKTFLKILEENMDCENLANHIRSVADECEAQSKLTQRTETGIKRQRSSDNQTDTPKHELEIVLRRQNLPTFSHPHKKQKLFVQRTGHLLISMKAYQGSDENIGYIKHKVWEMKSELSTAAGIVCGCKFNDQRSESDRENTCTAALSVSFESGEKAIYQLFESKLFDFENYVLEDKAIIVSLEKKCIKITVEVEDVEKLRELQKDIESGALLHRMVVWLQFNGLSCEDDDYLVIVVDAIKIKQLQQQLQTKAQHKSYTDFMDFITLEKKWLENVDSTAVVPYLWEQDVLDNTEKEEVIKVSCNQSNFKANSILLNYIRKKGENWLPKSIWAFTKAGYGYIFEDALVTLDDIEEASLEDIFEALKIWIDKIYKKDTEKAYVGSELLSTDKYQLQYSADVLEKFHNLDVNVGTYNEDIEDKSDRKSKRKQLVLRAYQSELENYAKQGENCLILAPTGSGKTHVAMGIIQHHLTEEGFLNKRRKVAFLVPYSYLVRQLSNMYREYHDLKSVGLLGVGDRVDLHTSIENNDIIVMTPQLLLEAVRRKDVTSISEFTLLIFDECHHATGKHPYNQLMKLYMKDKWHKHLSKSELPQVVGLTASVGVGEGGSLEKAKEHILRLCANLDSRIVTVKEQQDNLKQYLNNPIDEIFEVDGRLYDPFYDQMCQFMEWIEDTMKYSFEAQSVVEDRIFDNFMDMLKSKGKPGSLQYKQWICTLQLKISMIPDQRRGVFFVCLYHLLVYTNAIEVHMDCRSEDAMDFIQHMFNSNMEYKQKIKEWEVEHIDRTILKKYTEKKPVLRLLGAAHPNPKLQALKKLILRYISKTKNGRGIIVCKTINLAVALLHWASNDTDIKSFGIGVKPLVGARRSEHTAEQDQTEMLSNFKSGKVRLLIATYFEGMDIPGCNFDIMYEHATNEITRIQAKGRGRLEGSVHANIEDPTLGNIEKELESQQSEKLMHQAIAGICSMPKNAFISQIEVLQQRSLLEESIAIKRSALTTNAMGYTIRCKKCDQFVCNASDLRCLDANHYIVIDASFYDRVQLQRYRNPGMMGTLLEKRDKLICPRSACGQDWGINAIYKYTKIPILKKGTALIFHYEELGRSEVLAEWSTLPFKINDLEEEEFLQYQKGVNMSMAGTADSNSLKLRVNRVYLVENLNPGPLFDYLLQDDILNLDTYEELQYQATRRQKCHLLLSIVARYGNNAYDSFIHALKETGQAHIADRLENFDSAKYTLIEAKAFEVPEKPDVEQSSNASEDTPGFLETSDYGSIVSELQATKEVNSLIKQPFITSQQYDAVLIHSHDDHKEAAFFKQCMERFIILPNKQSASIYMAEWNEIISRAFDLEGLVKECCLWFVLIDKNLGEIEIIKDNLMLLHAKSAGRLVPVMKKEADYLSLKDTYMSSHHLKYVWQKQGVIIDHLVKGKVWEDFRNLDIDHLTRSDVNQKLVDKLLLLFNYYLNERLSQVKQKKQALLEWIREEDVTDNTQILAEFMDEIRRKEERDTVFNKAIIIDEKKLYDIMDVECKDKFHELSKSVGGASIPDEARNPSKALLQSWKQHVDESKATWRELYDRMLQFKCSLSAAQLKLVCDKDSLVKNLKEIESNLGAIDSDIYVYLYQENVLNLNQWEKLRDPYSIAPSNRWKYVIMEVLVDEPCNYDSIKKFFQTGVEPAESHRYYYTEYLKTLMLCPEDLVEDE